MGLQVGWGGVLGNQQGGANSVNQIDGGSIMVATCGGVGRVSEKGAINSFSPSV